MALIDTISADLVSAMKARDEVTKQTLRMLKSDLGKKEVKLGRALDEAEELTVLTGAVKSRRDSIAAYEEGGRSDLADAERAEIDIVSRYLPKQLSEDEARAAIRALKGKLGITEKKQMGQLMKAVMDEYRGQIDGKLASKIAGSLFA